ncbi:MAG TPA: hypothetical protein VF680_17135 [Allosphingosinicella sp.]|jgi:hypothetical protein
MKFDLNASEFENGSSVFNNGIAGRVDGVSIDVQKRKADEPDSYPPYKLVVTDGSGAAPINQGFYFSDADDEKRQTMTLQRIRSIAQAVVPEGFTYPVYETYEKAVDGLFKIIKEHAEGKKVNVFVAYGYDKKPSKFLGLRMFNFIESPTTSFSRLKATPSDIMERPKADDGDNADKPDGDKPASGNADIW